jgi:hypothetical protein
MPDTAGFAAAITVREHVLRTALQAAYANGSDAGKKFTEDLSDSALGMKPDLFLGPPDFNCEGSTNLLVATLPMWGTVKVTQSTVEHQVQLFGEMELTLTPDFRTGPLATDSKPKTAIELDQFVTTITARRWTATVTSAATPPEVAILITGNEFRTRFEDKFRKGVFIGRVSLPSIEASFLGSIVDKATGVLGRVRDGVLLIGLKYEDADHTLVGNPDNLQDFARSNDVAGVVHEDAADIMLDELHAKLVKGVEDEGVSLDSFSVRPRGGYFYVSGAVSKSSGTVNFSFRVVPSMFHTRPGATFHRHGSSRLRWHVHSRTWPALGFRIEGVDTDVDRKWWVILFGEVILGILTLGMSIICIEGMVAAAASTFGGRIESAKPGAPANRIRRTIPPAGGVSVRVGLDQFEITDSGVYVGISVRATPLPALLFGPITVPANYAFDAARYILQLPSGISLNDPALRIRWTLEDRNTGTVLVNSDGPAHGRLRFDFVPGSFAASDFGVLARLYRQLGVEVTDIATQSVNVHMRSSLPPGAYVRWRAQVLNPQFAVDQTTDTWVYNGDVMVRRWSEWHRTDQPCLAVNADERLRYDIETADRLPFPLRLLETHRKGLCPYCFYGGPAGVNAAL